MARLVTAPRLAILTGPRRRSFARVYVENPDSVYVDVGNLFGFNFFDGASILDNIDNPVPSGTITLRREHRAPNGTIYSLSPTVAGSPINRNALDEYARFLKAGRGVRVFLGWDAAGAVANYPADFLEVFRGKIDEVDWKGSDGKAALSVRGLGAWLLDKTIEEERVYSDDTGVARETVMQQILDDNEEPRLGPVVLYVPEPTGTMVRAFRQERKSVLEALRDLAFQIGWDVRYKWLDDGTYRLTLYEPDRENTEPDWTLGPANYFDVTQLKETDADVRNRIRGKATAADGAPLEYVAEDPDSVSEHGTRYMEFTEDATGPIDTLPELTTMVESALADLKDAPADQEIENDLMPNVEVGDLGEWLANGKHYDADQVLAVVQVRHEFTSESRRTYIQSRGTVVGGSKEWIRRGKSKIGPLEPDEFDPSTIYLGNFRELERQPTYIRYGWQPSPAVSQIWVYLRTQEPSAVEPWPPSAAEIADGATPVPPSKKLTGDTGDYVVQIPPNGKVTYVQFQPLDAALNAGDVQRTRVFASQRPPTIETVQQAAGPTGLRTAVAFDVIDPQQLGGTLSVWTNPESTDNADADADPDGTLTVVATPTHVDFEDDFTTPTGTSALLAAVKIHPGKGKRVFFEFVNSDGVTSGKVSVTLLTNTAPIIDEAGELVDGAIKTAFQFATGITPVQVLAALPPGAADGTVVLLTTDGQLYRRVAGAWTLAIPAVNITGEIVTSQLNDLAVTAAKIANAAVNTAKFAAGIRPVRILAALPGAGDVQGDTVFLTSDNKLYRWTGSAWTAGVPTGDLSGTIDTAQIANDAITALKIAAGAVVAGKIAAGVVTSTEIAALTIAAGNIAASAITTAKIAAGAVDTAQLAALSVTSAVLAANAVITAKIAAGAVDTAQLANLAVTSGILAANAVTTTKITDDAVTTAKIVASAITAAKIAAGTITATEIAANTITAAKIAAGTITATEIAALTILAGNIAAGQIVTSKLAAGAVTANEIAALTIVAGNIASGTITGGKIAANTITAANITALTITAAEIAALTITAAKIAAHTITATEIAALTITAAEIAAGTITGGKIAAGTVTAANIQALTITAAEIAATTITGAKIAAGTITATNIAADTITAGEIAAGAISTSELAAGAVTAVKIAAGTITANEIAALTITAAVIAAGTITGAKIAAATIDGTNIKATTITAGNIAAGTITATELAASSIVAGKIAAGAINSSAIIVDGVITAAKISVSVLSGISANMGTVVAGRLESVNGYSYFDLNATGASHFIHHANGSGTYFYLGANGTAYFAGEVGSSSFTTGHAIFSGSAEFKAAVNLYVSGGGDAGVIQFIRSPDTQAVLGDIGGTLQLQCYNSQGFSMFLEGELVVQIANNDRFRVLNPFGDLYASVNIAINLAGTEYTNIPVRLGAANSGGSGFRLLRIANTA